MTVACVVLAAGMGTRFGGPKQLVPVGPADEPLFVLTARQALAAGVDRIVVVTRTDLAADVAAAAERHLGPGAAELVQQDRVGPARPVPWGTAHAVCAAAPRLDGPFVVVNGDDLFGPPAVALAVEAAVRQGPRTATVVALRLDRTLSTRGPVTRAICRLGDADELIGLDERRGLVRHGDEVRDASGGIVPPDAWVSMNLLALPASLPDLLAGPVERFEREHATGSDELLLPDELDRLARAGELELRIVRTDAAWCGITHPGDEADVRAAQLPMREL